MKNSLASIRQPPTPTSMPAVVDHPAATPRVGTSLGPYRLGYQLGSGGMANVFLAHVDGYAGVHRVVAVKCILPGLTEDQAFLDMFFDEARIASQIHHPNVCSVLHFDVAAGHPFIVMEYLSGQNLKAIRETPEMKFRGLDPRRRAGLVARILADAAEGLHAAHELRDHDNNLLNVVHRDISPENLFVTYDGATKVMDFGVATAAQQTHETRAGVLKGKYSYLPPEALAGQRPDRRGDVWSLGVVLWELLTGQRLFHGATDGATLSAVNDLPILPPSQIHPGIPATIDAIVLKALSRDIDARFQTARDVGRALTQFLVDERLAIGPADVADLMTTLFPERQDQRRAIVALASDLDHTVHNTVALDTNAVQFLRTPMAESEPARPTPGAGPSERVKSNSMPATPFPHVPPPPRGGKGAMGVGIAAMLLAAVSLGAQFLRPQGGLYGLRTERRAALEAPETPAEPGVHGANRPYLLQITPERSDQPGSPEIKLRVVLIEDNARPNNNDFIIHQQ